MGCWFSCFSSNTVVTSDQAQNQEIEQQLARDRAQNDLDFKILLLGAGESGKSTVVKQLTNIFVTKPSHNDEETRRFRDVLQSNTIAAMRWLLKAAKQQQLIFMGSIADVAERVHELDDSQMLSDEVVADIQALWSNEQIQALYEKRSEFYFPDAGPYYFKHLMRFNEPDFTPTEEDIVMARIRTTGMFQTEFDKPPVHWRVVDVGGQRSERKKWMRFFDDVQAIIFVVNTGGYNKVLFEDQTKNRLHEAIELFDETVNKGCFADTPIFTFFNKKDIFEECIRKSPLKTCFPEHDGSTDVHECLDFVSRQFSSKMPAGKAIAGSHFISARFKKNVRHAFEEVQEVLVSAKRKQIKKAVKAQQKAG